MVSIALKDRISKHRWKNSDLGYNTLSIPVGMAAGLSARLFHRRDAKTASAKRLHTLETDTRARKGPEPLASARSEALRILAVSSLTSAVSRDCGSAVLVADTDRAGIS